MTYKDTDGNGSITQSEILQEQSYYPFGLAYEKIQKTALKNRYQYNGIEHVDDFGLGINMARYRDQDPAIGRFWQIDPKAEYLYGQSPYSWPMNSPIVYNDPEGDIAPLVIAGIALAGGIVNTASHWGNINSFAEGLNYFATGAAGLGVGAVNPVAGGLIWSGGNLSNKAINGHLNLSSFGSVAGEVASAGLDFLTVYTLGASLNTQWASFMPTGTIGNAELSSLAKQGIRPSITQIGGTGLRKTVAEQAIKNTTVQVANHSSKRLAQNLINAGIQRPLNSAAHHIVAGGSGNQYAQMSRDILRRAGVGIDDATNGVFLPKNLSVPNPPTSIHSTIHTKTYFQNVYNRISRVPLNEVGRELELIRSQLLNGKFPF